MLSLGDLDPIDAIRDQSGEANDASQATSAKKPTYRINIVNGRAIARFDGVDDALAGTTTTPAGTALTYISVVKVSGANGYGTEVSMGIPAGGQEMGLIADNTGTNIALSNFAGPTATNGDRYTTTANTAWHVASLVYAPTATPVLFKSGGTALGYTTAIGDWTTANLNNGGANYPFALGAAVGGISYYGNVDMAATAIYKRALTDAERTKLERWFGSIFGITIT